MANLWPVARREIKSFLCTPVAYMAMVVFLLLSGILFLLIMNDYAALSFDAIRTGGKIRIEGLTVAEGIYLPLFHSISFIMLLMMPLLTMRSFSEEKKTGTIEMLFTYPLTDMEIVLGKFLGAFAVFLMMLGLTLLYTLAVLFFKPIPTGEMLAGYLGLVLLGGSFITLGLFISSLTENQIISAACTFGMIMLFWIIGLLAGDSRSAAAEVIRYLSIFDHFESFASGIIDTRNIVYYVSFGLLFIFLTLRVMEANRMRS